MIQLKPEQRITIYPHLYHEFHVIKGRGDVLIGEVSIKQKILSGFLHI